MKKIIFILGLVASVQVMGSKARIIALGTPMHLVDYQLMTYNPIFVHQPDALVLESGLVTSTNTRNNAEAVLVYTLPDKAKLGLVLGKNDELYANQRLFINSIVGANTYKVPQNAIHMIYGNKSDDLVYSIGGSYSNFEDKLNSATEGTAGLVGSVKKGPYLFFGSYSFVNSYEVSTVQKFDGAGTMRLAGRYLLDTWTYGFDFTSWLSKSSTNGTEDESYGYQNLILRVINSLKNDGHDLFYGIGVNAIAINCKTQASVECSTRYSKTMLPVLFGFEAQASELLVLRGSITQTLGVNSTEDEIGLPAASGIPSTTGAVTDFSASPNTTSVAAGLGLKFNKVLIDGTMGAATSQVLNSNSLFTQASLTYTF